MIRILSFIIIAPFLFIACSTTYKPANVLPDINSGTQKKIYPIGEVSDSIKSFFLNDTAISKLQIKSSIYNLKKIYELNKNLPLWKSDSLIQQGIQLIVNSKYHGLNPNDYNKQIIDSLSKSYINDSSNAIQTLALLDITITDGLILFSRHLFKGKLVPTDYHSSWNFVEQKKPNSDTIILSLISQNKINEFETYFQPNSNAYGALKGELIKFKQIKTDSITYGNIEYPGFILRKGDSNQSVLNLKQELKLRGFLNSDSLNYCFDIETQEAIMNFQTKHGITADGIPGKKTYEFLKWSTEQYINTLKVNMERIRWLPEYSSDTIINVNIPAYQLKLYANSELLFSSKVIVGKRKNQTPVFWSYINYLVFNPCWTIPNSIASKKILPRLKTDSSYIDKRNMFITLNGETKDHSNIDFSQYNETNFPYKIFQRTGTGNALGKVKFMFQNGYSIYLHDTPGKSLFGHDHRTFSHGCVRVQNAVELSEIIFHKLDGNKLSLSYYFDKGYPEKVYLKTPIPLQLLYLTCDYNTETDQVQYFKDVYIIDYTILRDLIQD